MEAPAKTASTSTAAAEKASSVKVASPAPPPAKAPTPAPPPDTSEAAAAPKKVPAPAPPPEAAIKEKKQRVAAAPTESATDEPNFLDLNWVWAQAPSWAPFAALAAAVLAGLALGLILRAPASSPPAAPSVRAPPVPAIVRVQPEETALQTAATPAPSLPAPAPAPLPAPPTAVQRVAPAPAAKPQAVAPAPINSPPAAAPTAAPSLAKPAPLQQPLKLEWARRLSSTAAGGLRGLADRLPDAELALEAQVPAVEGGLLWASEIRPENAQEKAKEALPVVSGVAAKGTQIASRTGLEVGAAGLNVVADNLPDAGGVLQSAIEKVMPTITWGVHATADVTRVLASKLEEVVRPESLPKKVPQEAQLVLGKTPGLLSGAATGLDVLADNASNIEKAAAYGAGKATPILQAVLKVTSEVSQDASKLEADQLPIPEPAQVAGALRSVGVDPDQLAAQAQQAASDAAGEVAARLNNAAKLVASRAK